MQSFILGAGKTTGDFANGDTQLVTKNLISGQRVLDWTLHALEDAGISNITFVGGYLVEQVIELYPQLQYSINPKWDSTHVLYSLTHALEGWKGDDILLQYADTVFRPESVRSVLKRKAPVVVGTDSGWRGRLEDELLLKNAEKVQINEGIIRQVGRRDLHEDEADAQFTGLLYLRAGVVEQIKQWLEQEISESKLHYGSITDLLHYLLAQNYAVTPVDVAGSWAELDSRKDLARFVFGTKAETLHRIRPFMKEGLPCVILLLKIRSVKFKLLKRN